MSCGWGMGIVTPCSTNADTVCARCTPGYYSPDGSECQLWTVCREGETVVGAPPNHMRDRTCRDVMAPTATLVVAPEAFVESGAQVAVEFASSEPDTTFQYKLDGRSWSAGNSPLSLPSLASGPHTFQVRGTDAVGNEESAPYATAEWTVVQSGTYIAAAPSLRDDGAVVTVSVVGVPAGERVRCMAVMDSARDPSNVELWAATNGDIMQVRAAARRDDLPAAFRTHAC